MSDADNVTPKEEAELERDLPVEDLDVPEDQPVQAEADYYLKIEDIKGESD